MKNHNDIENLRNEKEKLFLENEELKQDNKIYLFSINILLLTIISILILYYIKIN